MYVNLGATPATTPALSPAQQSWLNAGIAAMPKCQDKGFYDCWVNEKLDAFPNCGTIITAWSLDKARLEKMVDDMPICACPPPPKCPACAAAPASSSMLGSPIVIGVVGAVAVALAGLLIYQNQGK